MLRVESDPQVRTSRSRVGVRRSGRPRGSVDALSARPGVARTQARCPSGGQSFPLIFAVAVTFVSVVAAVSRRSLPYGGEGGIRTHEAFRPTRSPGEHLRPLGHLTASGTTVRRCWERRHPAGTSLSFMERAGRMLCGTKGHGSAGIQPLHTAWPFALSRVSLPFAVTFVSAVAAVAFVSAVWR